MSEEIRYYKGKYKVKVVTESAGYWIVEALEDFEDVVDGEKVIVKIGERRIVPSNTLRKQKDLPTLKKKQMEKKLKRAVIAEKKQRAKKNHGV